MKHPIPRLAAGVALTAALFTSLYAGRRLDH